MSIIRAARSSEGRYVQIMNAALQDDRLSLRARGLLAYVLSLPPESKLASVDLASRLGMGRDAIRKLLAELEKHGYLQRKRTSTGDKGIHTETIITDDPGLFSRGPEKPGPENPPHEGLETQALSDQALKDKDGTTKRNPSGSSEPTVSQRANAIARGFCDKHPLHSFHGVRSIVTRAIQAGHADARITDVLMALAAADKPVTLGTIRWELEGPPKFDRQQRQAPSEYDRSPSSRGLDEVLW